MSAEPFNTLLAGRTIRELENVRPFERLVLGNLASHANREGICWPSYKTIARGTGMSIRSATVAVRGLRDKGLIQVKHQKAKNGGDVHNLYRLTLPVRPPEHPHANDDPGGTSQAFDADVTGFQGPRQDDPGGTSATAHKVYIVTNQLNLPIEEEKLSRPSAPAPLPANDVPSKMKKAAPRSPAEKTIESSTHQKVIAAFVIAYTAVKGIPPIIDGAEARGAKDLLTKLKGDADEAIQVIQRAFEDVWFVHNSSSLSYVARKVNSYRGARPTGRKEPLRQLAPVDGSGWSMPGEFELPAAAGSSVRAVS